MCGAVGHVVVLSLNQSFVENCVILEKYKEAINLALQSAFMLPFWRMNTTKILLLEVSTCWSVQITWERQGCKQRDEGLGSSVLLVFDGGSDDRLDADE